MSEARPPRPLGPWPFAALGVLALIFLLMLVFSRKAPVITSLEPAMAAPGETVVVTGDYFGRTEREGSLSLSGEIPPPSLIQSWSDQKIVFKVPEDAASGLVSIANSQGTSVGVLFTNTRAIPTVLQSAGAAGVPLLWGVVPSAPSPGQTVTLSGRGFGSGDEPVVLRIAAQPAGPVLEIGPRDCLSWTDRSVSFRVPSGTGPLATVRVHTPRGETEALPLPVAGPVTFVDPRTVGIEVRARVSSGPGATLTLWGPVPRTATGTTWTLVSATPNPLAGARPLAFSLPPGQADRTVAYQVTMTSWARRWDGLAAGQVPLGQEAPAGSAESKALWKPAAAALKTLTARWGLETPDPWLRIQRLQTGLAAAFKLRLGPAEPAGLTAAPAQLLADKALDSYEASTLALALADTAGIPGRLVGGLWLDPAGPWFTRTWAEVWIPGAGWVSWDPLDGSPGSLDNRHFAFEVTPPPPARLVPRSATFGPRAPGSLGTLSGEASGTASEPVVRWEIIPLAK